MAGDSLELLRKRAKEALARGDYLEARKLYERALIYRSDNPELHYGMATVCFQMDDLQSAAEHFREVIRLDPTRAHAYINLGAVYDRLEQFDESLEALRAASSSIRTVRRGVQPGPGLQAFWRPR